MTAWLGTCIKKTDTWPPGLVHVLKTPIHDRLAWYMY